MDRKKFIHSCGALCLGGIILSAGLQSCLPSRIVTGTLDGSDLTVPLSEFEIRKKAGTSYRRYLIVEHVQLNYPVCVYRVSENEYNALLMQCTHQGTELQVLGDVLQCPAHGSEFNDKGEVRNGPASSPLKVFPVRVEGGLVKISLKK